MNFYSRAMECLGRPVDHRLRKILHHKGTAPLPTSASLADHVGFLERFANGERYLDEPPGLYPSELNLALDLAGPDTTGGVVVALLQPGPDQTCEHRVTAAIQGSKTLDAVRELILVASNSRLTIDDVSVFDTLPALGTGVTFDDVEVKDDFIRAANQTFVNMIFAKRPNVVISCYGGTSKHPGVEMLRSTGIGQRTSGDISIYGHLIRRVNAFHPSYAINYHPSYSCLRRLLVLEFCQAFGEWRRDWQEESWMDELRQTCRIKAQELARGISSPFFLLHWI